MLPEDLSRNHTTVGVFRQAPGTYAIQHNKEECVLAKEELLEFDGMVTEVLPDARFRVKLDNEHEITAYTAGRMKRFRIRTMVGDRVTVEMTPYDLEKGRVVYRHKDQHSSRPGQRRRSYRRR